MVLPVVGEEQPVAVCVESSQGEEEEREEREEGKAAVRCCGKVVSLKVKTLISPFYFIYLLIYLFIYLNFFSSEAQLKKTHFRVFIHFNINNNLIRNFYFRNCNCIFNINIC